MDATPHRHDGPVTGRAHLLPAALTGVVGALLLATLLLAGVVPALTGARPVAVHTGDGAGGLVAGALAVVRPAPPEAGDVVAVSARVGAPLGLRKVLATSADVVSLNRADGGTDVVRADLVEGVSLFAVPWAGALRTRAATPSGMLFVAAGLLLLVAAHHLRSAHAPRASGVSLHRSTRPSQMSDL